MITRRSSSSGYLSANAQETIPPQSWPTRVSGARPSCSDQPAMSAEQVAHPVGLGLLGLAGEVVAAHVRRVDRVVIAEIGELAPPEEPELREAVQEEIGFPSPRGDVVDPALRRGRRSGVRSCRASLDAPPSAYHSTGSAATLAPMDETSAHTPRSRSSSAASPYTPTTASPTPSRRSGQRLEFDLTFDVPDCDAVLTDRVEDTVDYSEVCDIVALAATEKSYRTLERLCQVVAERLMERFDCESVRVRAAKPEPPVPYPVQEAGGRGHPRAVPRPRARRRGGRLSAGRGQARSGSATSASAPTSATARAAARGDRGPARPWSRGRGGLLALRDRAGRRDPRPAGLPQRRRPGPHLARARSSCSTSARRSRPSTAGTSAGPATALGRSTWTCCCSATSS